jgi:hypothetical protein
LKLNNDMIAATLDTLTRCTHLFPQVRKDELNTGDWVIIHTVKSVYTLHVLGDGLYEARGGWFDKKGITPMCIGVAGATWGGSAIMPKVLAACGMRIEFQNRMITSPVRSIVIFKSHLVN